ncbi:XRE family transcriptional regulator [Mycolicibacterium sp. 050232]|uniref:XRE family transcriptional regulator n=1 Tax=Mycolicibacterium sp. 050232 TaxID=3113982 RepID=UPI002E281AE0|nr:XRE family transcriptional regulator [Mycolicibacterium sp. 050232]MED5815732.1 XRE family transcriptional regulator [Mycolicibacterium sp. 050232]
MAEENPEPTKALTKNPLGPSGKAVAANVERLRNEQNLTFAALSDRLERLQRPIPPLGLRKIVAETRRVDADDLVGLAVALGVSPASLLMPDLRIVTKDDLVPITGWNAPISAAPVWRWLTATAPLIHGTDASFIDRALPSWERDDRMRPVMFPGEVQADGND